MKKTASEVQAGNALAVMAFTGETPAGGAAKMPHVSGDLVDLVKRMRTQQKIYFSSGKPSMLKNVALKEARALEKEVDTFISVYEVEAQQWGGLTQPRPEVVQPDLFLIGEGGDGANSDESQ